MILRFALAATVSSFVASLAPQVSAQTRLYRLSETGSRVCDAGDVDADGIDDLVVGETGDQLWCGPPTYGFVRVLSGRTGAVLFTLQSTSGMGDAFGWSVAAAGDVNQDGHADLLIGAPLWSDTPQCGRGRAYLYSGLDGTLLRTFAGTGGMANGIEWFGHSVASAGDVNGDGIPDVIIGAPYGLNYNGDAAGYARIYSGTDGSVIHTLYGNNNSDQFGFTVAGIGDVNLDGLDDVLVGTPASHYAGGCGSVRVYSGADGLILYFLNGTAGCIGRSAGHAGDVDLDGVSDFVCAGESNALVYSGATGTELHRFAAGPWSYESTSGAGDVNGDGHADIIVATSTGARVYSGANGGVLYTYDVGPTGTHAVSTAGDLNHDGLADVVVAWPSGTLIDVYLSGCPVPSTYCTAKLNSLGCMPSISSAGVLSLSVGADDFVVRATNVRNNQNGFMLWALNSTAIPFAGGTRCIDSPIFRTPAQNAGGNSGAIDCSGQYAFPFTRAYVALRGIAPGTTLYAQYWSRDPGYSPPNNIGLTNALSFVVCP
ncbi:MAG: FG-GAP repeat protein [Planctomycetes bacterium]|nr:FG-GAP repeat protein [Planctomycetota bacterium]